MDVGLQSTDLWICCGHGHGAFQPRSHAAGISRAVHLSSAKPLRAGLPQWIDTTKAPQTQTCSPQLTVVVSISHYAWVKSKNPSEDLRTKQRIGYLRSSSKVFWRYTALKIGNIPNSLFPHAFVNENIPSCHELSCSWTFTCHLDTKLNCDCLSFSLRCIFPSVH